MRNRSVNQHAPPLIHLPLDLSGEAAAKMLELLYELAHLLENHYAGQLYRYHNAIDERQAELWPQTEPPP